MSTTTTPQPAELIPEAVHTHDSFFLVRERRFVSSTDLVALMKTLRDSRSTGTLMLNFSHGSLCVIRYREETNVTGP
jgi:hypothetical protein